MALPAPEDVAAVPDNATKTESGLAYRILESGSGAEHPSPTATVEVHYSGWMTNGQMFDSSVLRGAPASFPLDRVIPGWTEGLQLMKEGDKARFWIPGALAYGDQPSGMGRPYGMLVFDVELLSFKNPPPPPETPDNLTQPPADARRTDSGLVIQTLSPGTSDASPSATSTVHVHYTGWMTNGEMFDSSVVRGEPISFGLNQVIPGWTEGLQLMKEGEKARLWIPGNLAYGETPTQPGYPYGTLVFDVELLSFR